MPVALKACAQRSGQNLDTMPRPLPTNNAAAFRTLDANRKLIWAFVNTGMSMQLR